MWKKPLIVGVGSTAIMVISVSLTVAETHVTIYDDGETYYNYTAYTDPEEILQDCDITLTAYDEYTATFAEEKSNVTLMIKRAFPVMVTADGETVSFQVTGGTVAELLQKAKITYTNDDRISLPLNHKLQENDAVQLARITYKEFTEKEPVPFTKSRPEGACPTNMKEQIVQQGKQGERIITKQTKYIDGVADETIVLKDTVTTKPIPEIVQYVQKYNIGVSQLKHDTSDVLLDENGIPINYKYKVNGKASAYSALGKPTKLVPGCVAMDFSKFPKGTKLYIKTPDGSYVYGYSKVADTGSFVHNGSGVLVDLFFNTYAESARFGIKNVDVYVLE